MNVFLLLLFIFVPTMAIWTGTPFLLDMYMSGELAIATAFLAGLLYAVSVYFVGSKLGRREEEVERSMELRGSDHYRDPR